MAYMNLNNAKLRNVTYALMVNMAGNIVEPTAETVQEAMNDFKDSLSTSDLSVTIANGPSTHSWPLSYVSYVTIRRDINKTDCSVVQELLSWISWAQLNDQAMVVAQQYGYIPLTNGWKRRMIDALGTIRCGGAEVLSLAVLIGVGARFPAYQAWASEYDSSKFKMKYFSNSNTAGAIEQMTAGKLCQPVLG